MPSYKYNSLTPTGRVMKGTIEAGSNEQAHQLLTEMNLTVNEITQVTDRKPKTAIGRSEFLLFNQQLASITKAGIPLERGLRELAADVASRPMRKLVNALADELEAGTSIEDAIAKHQQNFPSLYTEILKAGVQTGRLSEMLTSLNRHLETANKTRRIVFEAMCYPTVIFVVTITILTGLFTFVIPGFAEILTDMGGHGTRLPWLTQTCLSLAANWLPVLSGIIISIFVVISIFALLSTTAAGRRFKESLLLKMPFLGNIHHMSTLERFAESMALLISADTPMPECLRLSAAASSSEKTKLDADILASQIEQGAGILEAGYSCKMIPRLFLYSVQLGSQRSELQDNLYSLADMYGEQTRSCQIRLQAMLMPLMLIFLGVVIGMVILAMFLPMVSIIQCLM